MAALFGVVNALGWGYWTLDALTGTRAGAGR